MGTNRYRDRRRLQRGAQVISVAVNLAWLVPGDVGGSEEYTTRLLASVVRSEPADLALEIVASKRLQQSYPWMAALPFAPLAGPLSNRGFRILTESTQVHRVTRTADVVHHFGGRLPAVRNPRAILTIHDLQPLDMPANFSRAKRQYLRWAVQRSATAASLICTPSRWVAESIVERLGVSPDKVRPVSSTWDPALPVHGNPVEIAELGDGPVVLYPAATHPHKNHLTLLQAVDRLADRHRDLTLVLTGGEGRAEAGVASRVTRARVRVRRLGRVTPSLLSALIQRADVLAFPSRYEGFGLPLLEAMHAGTPVIAGDNSAMPEVVADAGLLLQADDPGTWADAIDEIVTNGTLASCLSAAGQARSEYYAPAPAAARLVDAWRSL
ncbi:MAG: glycosyltransferase family 4 protein [Acidimicrobiaceae bacterium]|nr:glycosyltransferase family 4 protein [Acidimicrobiaceae bacterium]MXW74789.1 glycosyltransferase family 4 protein [Acidimicrobiaceae bacterium]MYC42018.1 glycosyltransferase family 4 protein [Acidimicrobiaceae bacterium]MYD08020.1 glycosyltransferase family 4 protein [Acidimicrobiaceae bacterium]MYI58482.1 glycosyltransferase family 4 protein [Acidimicrobiaceae bacterium]